ncbi:hypothetical protein K450DRAFT_256480 [Umbelopsis ramanniana AG]|uniref:Uncharacterized protein n=1 Tax=Umbelopsis ramanniana AG TaxID=1314678 RepID=A0AAD5E4E4_UMBRA|nr:uncharacterized protein K450DRAFT_256480 [Umbelopsis ramanniana AG]KAI8576504.1 hypothetical protein K450DRAFT_256480 [Umbelopsis ramanniana AG]
MLTSANLRYPLHRRLQAHHALLVINCFPVKDSGLNTADVSYLIFYVTSRPHKLPKVASYMEHKLMEDVKNRRSR